MHILDPDSGSHAGTQKSETYRNSSTFRCNPSLIIHLLDLWLVSVCHSGTAELNSPAASLRDANLLPSGGKNPQLAFFNLADTSSWHH